MSLSLKIANLIKKILVFGRKKTLKRGELKNIKKKKNLIEKVTLTKEQKIKIDNLFIKNYGKKIKYDWHRLYQSYTGIFNERYFPEILFSSELEPKLNDREIAKVLSDKNLLKQLFGETGIKVPQTYFSSVNGILRDGNNELLEKEDITKLVSNKECVLKKTVETSSGRDVFICEFVNDVDKKSGLTIMEIISQLGENFVAQEKLTQFEELSTIYPNSINTFRVMSYIVNNEIFVAPIALRIARGGADRDNVHYGGITVGVGEDGYLFNTAFSEYGEKFTEHPDTKVVFEGYRISKVENLIESAKKLHACIPQLKMVSWDLSIDKDGNICIIEVNTSGQSAWFPQMIQGKSLFGDHTEYMLQLIGKGK